MLLKRAITPKIEASLKRGKSILLLGPRQTGKTTLVKSLQHDLYITLMHPSILQKYESHPEILISEIKAQNILLDRKPVVIIDEIQKIPTFTDSIQVLIDEGIAQFIITGSSARKIKNLLPGRVIKYNLTSLSLIELNSFHILDSFLINGSLPEVLVAESQAKPVKSLNDANDLAKPYINLYDESQNGIEDLLRSYVNLYIEEEIRKEALVRNIGSFANFLKLACIESGNTVNFTNISNEIGVSHPTISEYYRILEDCMLVERIEPLSDSITRKRLNKSPKFIIFDLGIKRIGAQEPFNPGVKQMSLLFEQFIGLELCRMLNQLSIQGKLLFWRSHDGPEVDYVINLNGKYVPIEVKWTDKPSRADIKHLLVFKDEYKVSGPSYVICRCHMPMLLADNVFAMPWQDLPKIVEKLISNT